MCGQLTRQGTDKAVRGVHGVYRIPGPGHQGRRVQGRTKARYEEEANEKNQEEDLRKKGREEQEQEEEDVNLI